MVMETLVVVIMNSWLRTLKKPRGGTCGVIRDDTDSKFVSHTKK